MEILFLVVSAVKFEKLTVSTQDSRYQRPLRGGIDYSTTTQMTQRLRMRIRATRVDQSNVRITTEECGDSGKVRR
jgi:hypothetical protein